jgi:hypothetical protein
VTLLWHNSCWTDCPWSSLENVPDLGAEETEANSVYSWEDGTPWDWTNPSNDGLRSTGEDKVGVRVGGQWDDWETGGALLGVVCRNVCAQIDPGELNLDADEVSAGAFTGGDPGEGLDLQGHFVYAVKICGGATFDDGTALVAGDATFTDDTSTPGFSVSASNESDRWGSPSFGDSAADNALEVAVQSIRWSNYPTPVTVVMENLNVGGRYKMQLLFYEVCCSRGFDVLINGVEVLGEFSPQREQSGIAAAGTAAVVTYSFTASSATLTVDLTQAADWPDNNPIINAVTLESV